MTAYQSSIWMEDSEGVLQRTEDYDLRLRRARGNSEARLPFILLSACCFLAGYGVFWVAGIAALLVSYWSGAVGFVLFWCFVAAGIWCVREAYGDGGEA